MNSAVHPKGATLPLLITVAFFCLALLPLGQAVVPAPDGGYPGGNTAEGQSAVLSLTTGTYNTGVGIYSLLSLTDGDFCTGVGAGTLLLNTAGENTATGAAALFSNTTAGENTADGAFALFSNTGGNNTANGARALLLNTTGGFNTAIGQAAMLNNDTGSSNIAIGVQALGNNDSGNGNIAIGNTAGSGVTTANNVICIGQVSGADVDNGCYIANIWGATIDPATATTVAVDEFGKLGTVASSKRFKEDIKPMDKASEALMALKPVTFHYKSDSKATPQFGLIAEEVATVDPNLVVRDKNGEIYTVRYEQINAMLLNEFLKEHRKVEQQDRRIQEQDRTIAQLRKEMETVFASLKEHDSRIQQVTDQFEIGRPGPQVVQVP
jgi:hypothetical protein